MGRDINREKGSVISDEHTILMSGTAVSIRSVVSKADETRHSKVTAGLNYVLDTTLRDARLLSLARQSHAGTSSKLRRVESSARCQHPNARLLRFSAQPVCSDFSIVIRRFAHFTCLSSDPLRAKISSRGFSLAGRRCWIHSRLACGEAQAAAGRGALPAGGGGATPSGFRPDAERTLDEKSVCLKKKEVARKLRR
ncbi:hypothetical protein EVAR_93447_1 [Eumeta japonica]|uniref:Uncharacterized protein n=1 Tax=Eumeta variegata TaxID=151549 RepID=A0A4C1TMF4_EUMVA|nr:hypothetical protein EVAR_93447_1 [Eumeta japonica]